MREWLNESVGRVAESLGESASDYVLSEADVDILLKLAGVAAHDSGDRTNAPLITYLAGIAMGRQAGRSLSAIADAASGPAS